MTQFPRRQFLSSSAAAAALALNPVPSFAAPTAKKPAKKPVLMKLGCQSEPTDDQHLKFSLAMASEISAAIPSSRMGVFTPPWKNCTACRTWPRPTTFKWT